MYVDLNIILVVVSVLMVGVLYIVLLYVVSVEGVSWLVMRMRILGGFMFKLLV